MVEKNDASMENVVVKGENGVTFGEDETIEDYTEENAENAEINEEGQEEDDEDPEATKAPRRSSRKTKKRKRNSSDSGGEDDVGPSQTVPLSNTDKLINIGPAFQAVIYPPSEEVDKYDIVLGEGEDRDEIIWENPTELDDEALHSYIAEAAGRFHMPIDRALYILRKCNYEFSKASEEVAKRRQLTDIWKEEESSLFQNVFLIYGKKFDRIMEALPHRSRASIIQHYYDTKKSYSYKTSLEARFADNDDEEDEDSDTSQDDPDLLLGTCENCGERVKKLKYNVAMNRNECNPCITYMRLMRVSRPADIRKTTGEGKKNHVSCPLDMRAHVAMYEEMVKPADGNAAGRLEVVLKKNVEDDDDDEIMIVDESNLRQPAPPFVVKTTEEEDPVDANTCRMTRNFDDDRAKDDIKRAGIRTTSSIPLVWRQQETRSMEDVQVLNEVARRKIFDCQTTITKVNKQKVSVWRSEMNAIRTRLERKSAELEIPSMKSGRIKHTFSWTEDEKKDAVRCFHWYGDDFESVSDVLGSKSADQLKAFYAELGQNLVDSIASYQTTMRDRMKESDIDIEKLLSEIL